MQIKAKYGATSTILLAKMKKECCKHYVRSNANMKQLDFVTEHDLSRNLPSPLIHCLYFHALLHSSHKLNLKVRTVLIVLMNWENSSISLGEILTGRPQGNVKIGKHCEKYVRMDSTFSFIVHQEQGFYQTSVKKI